MSDLEKAIEYFEDACRESDEIIEEASEKLRDLLIEQKKHFETALHVMRKCREEPCE